MNKICADINFIGVGGGGMKVLSREVIYIYTNGRIHVCKDKKGGGVPPATVGGNYKDVEKHKEPEIRSKYGQTIMYEFIDSHKNELESLEHELPPEIHHAIKEKDNGYIYLFDTPHGFGGDPEFGLRFLEDNKDGVIQDLSKYHGKVVVVKGSIDGGTGSAMTIMLLNYKNEIYGKNHPMIVEMSYPTGQKIAMNWKNIEFSAEELNDHLKRGNFSMIIYMMDNAKVVHQYNEMGLPIDEQLYNFIVNGDKPPLNTSEENGDLEYIRSTEPIKCILMGSPNYHKIHQGAIVDIKDVQNKINGKVVIPCYLRAKNEVELVERVSTLDLSRLPPCFRNGDIHDKKLMSELGIASTIYYSMAPLCEDVDRVLYIVKVSPRIEFEFGDLAEKIAEFASFVLGIDKSRVDVWTYEDNSARRDIECWAYLIVNDYKNYLDNKIKKYARMYVK